MAGALTDEEYEPIRRALFEVRNNSNSEARQRLADELEAAGYALIEIDAWKPGRWWSVLDPDETKSYRERIWCETSDEDEARQALKKKPGFKLYRQWRCEISEIRLVE